MAKSRKTSDKTPAATAPKKTKTRNKTEAKAIGRLIALEGTRGKDLSEAVKRLARIRGENGGPGYSIWDASNTFYELRMSKEVLGPPARSLLLLYASDLMFRLRWEIQPALEEGRTVVAAPYVESAVAMGIAAGLQKDWLTELFSFAPKPDTSLRLKEKAKKKLGKPEDGFVEFTCASLAAGFQAVDAAQLRGAVRAYLDELEARKELVAVGKKLKKLVVVKETANP